MNHNFKIIVFDPAILIRPCHPEQPQSKDPYPIANWLVWVSMVSSEVQIPTSGRIGQKCAPLFTVVPVNPTFYNLGLAPLPPW